MIRSTILALACAAGLLASAAAQAKPVTYAFTGTAFGGDFDGQTVTGTYSYDPALYDQSFSAGPGYLQSYVNGAPIGSARGGIQFSGGFSDIVGGIGAVGGVAYQSIVEKNYAPSPTGSVDGIELILGSADSVRSHDLQLYSQQSASLPDLIFPDGDETDLSATQPVAFMTPGSTNFGYYSSYDVASGTWVTSDFNLTSVTQVVPEASNLAMLSAGAALVLLARRRKARTAA